MPATSGSPTQIATSQPTKAALSNTPADQFQSGDLGYVQEELVAGRCPLYALVQSGGPTVDGTLVLSVYQQPNARWVSLTVLGPGSISVANIAELQALPNGSLKEGTWAYVRSVRAWWELASGLGATTDGITVVTAQTGGTARWVRQDANDLYWGYTTTWYVDPVAGNDESTGAASNVALKTVAEFCRRLRFTLPNTNYVVNVLADVPNTDVCNPQPRVFSTSGETSTTYGGTITFQGQRTVVRAGTTAAGTNQTDPSAAAATAQAEIVDAAAAWGADAARLVVLGDGRQAWVLTGKANVVGTAGRVTDWISSAFAFAAGNPGAGLAYNVVTLTKFRAQVQQLPSTVQTATGGFPLVFRDVDFDDIGATSGRPFNGYMNIRFLSCKLGNGNNGNAGNNFSFGMVNGFWGATGTLWDNSGATIATMTLGLNAVVRVNLFAGNGARRTRVSNGFGLSSVSGLCIQGGWFQVSMSADAPSFTGETTGENPVGSCIIGQSGSGNWLGVYNDFDLPAASGITDMLVAFQTHGCSIQGSVYGVGDGVTVINGLRADIGAQVKIRASLNEPGGVPAATAATSFNLQPSAGGLQLSLSNATTTMPNLNVSAGAVLPALAPYTTFAQYKAAPFSRQAVNWNNLCAFIGF